MEQLKQENGGFVDFVDFEKPDLNKPSHFPIEALPPVLGDYARAISESLQVSEDMAAVAVLGVVSLSVMGNFFIEPKTDWVESLNLYILITARPSERKTPVLKEVSAPVYEYVKEENQRRRPLYDKYLTQKRFLKIRSAILYQQYLRYQRKKSLLSLCSMSLTHNKSFQIWKKLHS